LFEYSDETFNTGIPEIDSIEENLSMNQIFRAVDDNSNNIITTENTNNIITIEKFDVHNIDPVDDNDDLFVEGNTFIDFSETNILGQITTEEE